MKRIILIIAVLAAVALSGCVTQDDLDNQTQDIEQKIEEEHHSVKKYVVKSVRTELNCRAGHEYRDTYRYNRSDLRLERLERVQEFKDGEILVVNGFESDHYESPHESCYDRYEWYENATKLNDRNNHDARDKWNLDAEVRIDWVEANYTIYENGGPVHSEDLRCDVWEMSHNMHLEGELEALVDETYETCFEVRR